MKVKWISLFCLLCVEIACVQSPTPNLLESQQSIWDSSQVAGPPVTRTQAVLKAHTFARIHWTMTEQNLRGANCDNHFISDYPLGPRIGMGYKWGGWDTVEDFIDKIVTGHGTGTGANVSYTYYPFDCVTGISCTGLVSRAWHLDEKYTLTYPNQPEVPNQFHEISHAVPGVILSTGKTENVKKGDAFMNATHIILFIYETRDGFPMVIDSRRNGVRLRKESWVSLGSQGYYVLRYNNIQEDVHLSGTRENPIFIQSFPYTHDYNTCAVVSKDFDRYNIESSANQQGPEVIYHFTLTESATIRIHVTDIKYEGINNDVFLLESLDVDTSRKAVDCIDAGDNDIEHTLEAGSYYISVDSNWDLPGEYTLTVSHISD